ncbi:hypothetical protein Rhe02_04070 [Rhizocola hellebori]|uniref:Uncharacterized protein n=1 Tax=Rhizocola hellebori TaxID=1392758 RepID=A0A8J3Q228_9ACTN|nr:hypothetical protein Rhe02_04070 [Rhizocola hellebori]
MECATSHAFLCAGPCVVARRNSRAATPPPCMVTPGGSAADPQPLDHPQAPERGGRRGSAAVSESRRRQEVYGTYISASLS